MGKTVYNDAKLTQIVKEVSSCIFVKSYTKREGTRNRRMLELICDCGETFHVAWDNFKRRTSPKRQCNSCGESFRIKKLREVSEQNRLTDSEYIQKKKEKGINIEHIEEYAGYEVKIKHICPECSGIWVTTPAIVLNGSKTCQKCRAKNHAEKTKNPFEKIKERLEKAGVEYVGGEYKTYETSIFELRCSCGKVFTRNYRDVMTGSNRCFLCMKQISYGEFAIINWLKANNYDFTHQQKFPDLKGEKGYPLAYDFGIFIDGDVKILVEYDGEHHFRPLYSFYKTKEEAEIAFHDAQKRDLIKSEYANDRGILLIRLNGKDYENLDAKLGEPLKRIKQYANTEVSENITRHRNA